MLTDTAIKHLKPKDKIYRVTDRDGMYVLVKPSGTLTFRLDYRMKGGARPSRSASMARPDCRSRELASCASTPSGRSARDDRRRLKTSGEAPAPRSEELWRIRREMADHGA